MNNSSKTLSTTDW